MKVPYNYLPEQFGAPQAIIEKWKELIQSSQFTLGPYVEAFESKFADFIGAKHVISTNTGTDALILSLKALGVGPGDEVISVPNTFYATIGAIVAVGATPVFIDVDDRYQMAPEKIEPAINSRTKAIIPVHWAGASPDMPKIMQIAKSNRLKVIEDACMAPGGSIQGKHPGTFGDANAFSMHPLKPLNVMGDGGMVATDSDELASWMRKYRNHGMIDRDHIEFWGVNMRLQPLQAIVASEILETVNETVALRNEKAAWLDQSLKDLKANIVIPPRPKGYTETYSLYIILTEQRDALLQYLQKHEIDAKLHYPIPLHLQEAARNLGYKRGSMPIAENQAGRILTLPCHQFLNKSQLNYMVETIADFYKQ
jgi:dTDP-3-amino-2,3,6-trideoxy-4-keto-D-glucose/dTDP-3-amino-3,4,6-trideoxy-alpha-D-glucose/dTDP-2,6-dideoxy-D-kanosamine transaminase